MKKLISFFAVLVVIMAASSIYAFAGSLSNTEYPVERFEITGGIDLQKDSETTFNSTRTVSGTAEKDTEIVITVYEVVESAGQTKFVTLGSYTTIVGLSEIFIQNVELNVGKNLVVVEAYNNGKYSKATAVIKRKKSEIKDQLQQGIVVPGQTR